MIPNNTPSLPPEYEYLQAPLMQAQEHVFLISMELERLGDNPLHEQTIVKLEDEKARIIGGIKNDFEIQTWEDGPAKFEEVENIIDYHFGSEVYEQAKSELAKSRKEYSNSNYWADKMQRNLAYYQTRELEGDQTERAELLKTLEWEYEFPSRNFNAQQIDYREIEPKKEQFDADFLINNPVEEFKTEEDYFGDLLYWRKEWDKTFNEWTLPQREWEIERNIQITNEALAHHHGYASYSNLTDKLRGFEVEVENQGTWEKIKDRVESSPEPSLDPAQYGAIWLMQREIEAKELQHSEWLEDMEELKSQKLTVDDPEIEPEIE